MDGKDILLNYSEVALGLLDRYRRGLKDALHSNNIDPNATEYVAQRFQVSSGLHFSLQPEYRRSDTPFRVYCKERNLSPQVGDALIRELGQDFRLYEHQQKAIQSIIEAMPTVISTGTGSGKTESFLIPIIDYCLTNTHRGPKAILIYPMNALANDQVERLASLTANTEVTFGLFTGATPYEPTPDELRPLPNRKYSRREMINSPPDILLTNYVMLDRLLTTGKWQPLIESCTETLKYIVLDELHTYRGSKAAHLMLLLRRLQNRLATPAIPIGASATLSRSVGYISDTEADTETLKKFVRKVLGVRDCCLVTPDLVPLPKDDAVDWPDPVSIDSGTLSPSMTIPEQARLLTALAGMRLSERDMRTSGDLRDTEFGHCISRHPFVVQLRKTLRNDGAKSLVDLSKLYRESCPHSLSQDDTVVMVRAWLVAIGILNPLWGDKPFLDLRLHLFVRALSGNLHRCLECDTYHPEGAGICPECATPLFLVDKRDVHTCLAKVRGRLLVPELQIEREDTGHEFFVRVRSSSATDKVHDNDVVPCRLVSQREDLPSTDGGFSVPFEPHPCGGFYLLRETSQRRDDVMHNSIPLTDRTHPRQYLRELVTSILECGPPGNRKLLAFVDDRERASQDASVLRDEFASAFMEGLLATSYPTEPPYLGIPDALISLHETVAEQVSAGRFTVQELLLLQELDLWFFRLIGEPTRFAPTRADLLQISESFSLLESERLLTDIFLRERAIDVSFTEVQKESRFIKFQKRWAMTRRQIHVNPADASKSPDVTSISLSENADEYREFLVELGTRASTQAGQETPDETTDLLRQGADEVRRLVRSLVSRDILHECRDGDKCRYALNPSSIVFSPSQIHGRRTDIAGMSMPENRALIASHHSSELKTKTREETERAFRRGDVHFLLATPTLEMGIDIGALQCVMMVGVPPMPSNYAQRAGRAGRRGQLSMIVCYCSDDKAHDRHYFSRPCDMINGLISPPAFHEPSWELLLKHVRAAVLRGHADSGRAFDALLSNISERSPEYLRRVSAIVDPEVLAEVEKYLLSDFVNECHDHLRAAETHETSPLNLLYKIGYLPDYGFHHDNVRVYEVDRYRQLKRGDGISPLDRGFISEREPELAVSKLAPRRTGYLAGDVLEFGPEGDYTQWPMPDAIAGDGLPVRTYSVVTATKEIRSASKDALNHRYDRKTLYATSSAGQLLGGILRVTHEPACKLLFLNRGTLSDQGRTPFSDGNGSYIFGYDLVREALVLTLPRALFADTTAPLSLLSALDRAIKERYRLDESEIKVLIGATPWQDLETPWEEMSHYHFVLYDGAGNSDLPFKRIAAEMKEVVKDATRRLHDCPYCDINGSDGCYYCLKSFYTQYVAPYASRRTAVGLLDYLMGEKPLVPAIRRFEGSRRMAGPVLDVRWKSNALAVGPPGEPCLLATQQDAGTLYRTVAAAIRKWFPTGRDDLTITTNLEHLVRNLSGHTQARQAKSDFAELRFELLRFGFVRTEKT